MSKVTYLFGAGASYGTRGVLPLDQQPFVSSDDSPAERGILRGLPILQEFSSAIDQIIGELSSFPDSNDDNDFKAELKYIIPNVLVELSKVSRDFPTVDTYAKMLYSTKQSEQYEKFKTQLSLFFIIWQHYHKQDLRYDSFIASLIDAESCTFPELTILSWNYDLQFEIAYSKYIMENRALWKIWDMLNVFYKSSNELQSFNVSAPFAFIKLNGSALFHSRERDQSTLRFSLQDLLWQSFDENQFWHEIYSLLTNGCPKHDYDITKYKNDLSYSWENENAQHLLTHIEKRVEDCTTLVVIGYSFPYVNRYIDRHIIGSMPNLSAIHIQDKNPDGIEERIKAIFDYQNRPTPMISSYAKDLDTFYIPNELG